MAHLWFQVQNEWVARQLSEDCANVAAFPEGFGDGRLVRAGSNTSPVWALAAAPGTLLHVNGRAVVGGLRVLNDRDLIRTPDGARYFFSSESLAEVKPFPGSDRPVFCGRCRLRIDSGSLAVCCPGCGIWFHQVDDLPCWTYSERCSYCGRDTALDAGFAWTPEN